MRLKGEMVIELTDTNTGAVETVQETNMITEAVNNILGLDPMGIYLKASGEYDNSVLWNGTLLPICPNMIGGILLFPAVLEEKVDHIYEQGKNLPVAYASNHVNSGSDVARGSLNQTESKKLDNGYKFVWEFTPSQGNGNIAAVRLIWPCMSGKCGPAVRYNRLYACAGGLLIIDRKNRVFLSPKMWTFETKTLFCFQKRGSSE